MTETAELHRLQGNLDGLFDIQQEALQIAILGLKHIAKGYLEGSPFDHAVKTLNKIESKLSERSKFKP